MAKNQTLTDEEKKARRRKQLADAQARRRQKLVAALGQTQQAGKDAQELEGLRARVVDLEQLLAGITDSNRHAEADFGVQRIEVLESQIKELENELKAKHAKYEHRYQLLSEKEAFLREADSKLWEDQQALRKREDELKDREERLGLVARGPSLSGSERAQILLDKISGYTDWGGKKMDWDSRAVKRNAEHIGHIVRQVRTARTTLAKVLDELKDILTPDESAKIAAARSAIYDLAEAAQLAKEKGERLAKERAAEEQAISRLADRATRTAFADLLGDLDGQLLMSAWSNGDGTYSDFTSFVASARDYKPGDWSYDNDLKKCLEEPIESVASQVRRKLTSSKDTARAAELAAIARTKFDEQRLAIEEKWGNFIMETKAALVAHRLTQAGQKS